MMKKKAGEGRRRRREGSEEDAKRNGDGRAKQRQWNAALAAICACHSHNPAPRRTCAAHTPQNPFTVSACSNNNYYKFKSPSGEQHSTQRQPQPKHGRYMEWKTE